MKNKILIFGKGFIGTRIHETLGGEITEKHIYSYKDAEQEVKKFNPEILINAIGSTGKRNVDDCEKDIDGTLLSNTFVPIYLAEVCLRNRIKFIHISSGCIYDFDYSNPTPITEEDPPKYWKLFYSRTKIYSEQALLNFCKGLNFLILRIRIPLDNRNHPKNILSKLLKYKDHVIDVPNSITYIPDFLEALKHLIKIDARGLFNVVNDGALKYSELLDVYKKFVPDFNYRKIDLKDLKLERTNLILSVEKLKKTGFPVRKIQEVLEECVKGFLNFS